MERQYCFLYLGVAYLINQKAVSCVLCNNSRNGVLLTRVSNSMFSFLSAFL